MFQVRALIIAVRVTARDTDLTFRQKALVLIAFWKLFF